MPNIVPMQTVVPITGREYSPAQLVLVRRTVAQDTTDDEFSMFIEVCRRVGLDPFRRQVYCLVYNKNKPDKRKVVFITGIDGFRACAARNNNYRPDEEEPEFVECEATHDNPAGIKSAKVTVWKMDTEKRWFPIRAVARWDEFAPMKEEWAPDETGRRQPTGKFTLDRSGQWVKMARHMLAKCAEAQALRKGWPEDLSGVYSPEEMDQARSEEWNAAEQANAAEENARLERIHAANAVPMIWEYNGQIEFTPEGQFHDMVMAWIRDHDAAEVDWFVSTNKIGLQQYWALDPNAALDLKKHLEAASKPTLEAGE